MISLLELLNADPRPGEIWLNKISYSMVYVYWVTHDRVSFNEEGKGAYNMSISSFKNMYVTK